MDDDEVFVVAVVGADGEVGPDAPDPWRLSGERAQISRELLVAAGVADPRLARVTGKADRNHVTDEPSDSRNRRIEITLLRRFEP